MLFGTNFIDSVDIISARKQTDRRMRRHIFVLLHFFALEKRASTDHAMREKNYQFCISSHGRWGILVTGRSALPPETQSPQTNPTPRQTDNRQVDKKKKREKRLKRKLDTHTDTEKSRVTLPHPHTHTLLHTLSHAYENPHARTHTYRAQGGGRLVVAAVAQQHSPMLKQASLAAQ